MDFWSLLFPQRCLTCSAVIPASAVVCPACRAGIELSMQDVGPFLRAQVPVQNALAAFRFVSPGTVRSIVHAMKYADRPRAGVQLLHQFPEVIQPLLDWELNGLVPVPQSPKKYRKRGYNQLSALTQWISERTQLPVRSDLLKRRTSGTSQASKNKSEREEVKYDFYTTDTPGQGKHLLLIDDILTTGGTLAAAAWPLIQQGYRVSVWVLARDEKGI